MDGDSFSLELCDDISRIAAPEWDSVAGTENPFVCHAFLAALEAGKAIGGDTGWDPLHLVMRDDEATNCGDAALPQAPFLR